MIHDILLSCLSESRNGMALKGFLTSEAVNHFIHPCEREIFMDILNIINYVHEVVEFTKLCKFAANKRDEVISDGDGEFVYGFYLIQFAKGVEIALEYYYDGISELELRCRKLKHNSLVFVYTELQKQLPMILLLRKLIREVKMQKLHGCALLNHLHQQSEHGDEKLAHVVNIVVKQVKFAFFSYLAHWLLFGVIEDEHSEFFIKFTPHERDANSSPSSGRTSEANITQLNLTKMAEDYIWQYEINFQQLPGFLSSILAEKVLFVGQTVLVFKMNRHFASKDRNDPWSLKLDDVSRDTVSELWNGKEPMFFQMIEDLSNDEKINVIHVESVIYEIKKYVSMRLSEIAVNEVDLEGQMGLVKDIYLLGRGEFYFEFLSHIKRALESDSDTINYTHCFEASAILRGIGDHLEYFTLSVQKQNIDPDESCEFEVLQTLHLKYIYKWPLNLLFSPTTIERYNKVFRFLLILRKLQFDLQHVWARHTWIVKTTGTINVALVNLRNHLMFFLDNLQYYIQVDVLESQFSILMNTIRNRVDFEELQKAHSIFLVNVLSQCFLLSDSKETEKNTTEAESQCQTQNPVHGTLMELFNICEKFAILSNASTPPESDETIKEVERLEERFEMLIASLIQLLVDIKTASCLGPLSQLLLRLDYNRWFSAGPNTSIRR